MKNTISTLLMAMLAATLCVSICSIAFAQTSTSGAAAPPAQTAPDQSPTQFAANTVLPVELSKSLDAKKLKVGDPVEAKTSVDLLNGGQIVLARDSKVLGHVTSVKAHTKESPDSSVAIAFDRVTMKNGHELPLQASVQAVGPPVYALGPGGGSPMQSGGMQSPSAPMGAGSSSGGSSSGGSMGGSRPSMGGSSSGGSSSQSSYPSSSSTGAYGGSSPSPAASLSLNSQGVVGLKDISLTASPQASVFSSSTKNIHLDSGTQMILKTQ